jgi:hypothetical protein
MAISKAEKARRVQARAEAVEYVRPWIDGIPVNDGHGSDCEPGCEGHQTVHVSVTRVARSGMSRRIRVLIVNDGRIFNLSYRVAMALGWRYHDGDGAVHVDGCGMDMGFHLVSSLSALLYHGQPRADYRLRKEWI